VRLRDFAASPAAAAAASAPAAAAPTATAVRATPLARRVAEMRSVDLSGIPGSGAGGRIRKADVESATPGGAPTGPMAAGSIMAFSGMRRAIAEKMTRSHQQVPAVTLVTRADVTELATLRERMNAYGGDKVSYTDFVLKAAAAALREFPLINSVVEGSSVKLCTDVNIGVAVALDAGLIVPVIRGADALSLRQIGAAARTLAARAREGSLAPAEYTGGTFTVTNLGMYGITEFTPIINLPESAILGVGAIEEQLRMGAAGVEVHKVMSLCLTHDHRHIDGAPAAQFLSRVRQLLESCYLLAG
ncbi:MAG TPA: dihydrolipoamide acetyltransferase family protein, partial [Spirochaetia bacterium]|nr:dihydrolipoamide acetyltransferase family protein [Spirochaetia bacterium]